jgi:hypothetical protein
MQSMSLAELLIGLQVLDNSWNPQATAHAETSMEQLLDLAASAGSSVVRIPADLSPITASGVPRWQVEEYGRILAIAAANDMKIVFEPGQTPPDLSQDGTPQGHPDNLGDLQELASRFAMLVETVHQTHPLAASVIAGWEVGNEPNLSYQYEGSFAEEDVANSRFYTVSLENAELYARYLDAVDRAVDAAEGRLGHEIDVIAAGIAHNDAPWMDRMLGTLAQLGSSVEGFAIHPYTTYDYHYTTPQSGRPTDWAEAASDGSSSWDLYFSFQAALANIRDLMAANGFGNADLWITETGVPSYLGYRNAGPAGALDQANWIAEAFGVIDSMAGENLRGVMVHHVLDNLTAEENAAFNAYDAPSANDGNSAEAEGSFALFELAGGTIVAKPAVEILSAIAQGRDLASPTLRFVNLVSSPSVDLSASAAATGGYVSGFVVLSHGGNDRVFGG